MELFAESHKFKMTRAALFDGAELLQSSSPYEDAYQAGLSAPYAGPNRIERYRRPDGTEFAWESTIHDFGRQTAKVTFFVDGVAAYGMVTHADYSGWHDEPWYQIDEM